MKAIQTPLSPYWGERYEFGELLVEPNRSEVVFHAFDDYDDDPDHGVVRFIDYSWALTQLGRYGWRICGVLATRNLQRGHEQQSVLMQRVLPASMVITEGKDE